MNQTYNIYCDESCHLEHDGIKHLEYDEYIKSKDRTWRSRNSFNIMVAEMLQKYDFFEYE